MSWYVTFANGKVKQRQNITRSTEADGDRCATVADIRSSIVRTCRQQPCAVHQRNDNLPIQTYDISIVARDRVLEIDCGQLRGLLLGGNDYNKHIGFAFLSEN